MEIKRPWLALWIYLGIGFLLWRYGMRDGSLFVFCILAGLFLYRGFSPTH